VVEDKSAGSALIQYTRRNQKLIPLIPYDPGSRDKISRAAAATPTIEAGNVWLPSHASWLEDFLSEHQKFPNDTHDDQVDTTAMMVEYFNSSNDYNPRARSL
jgi:predicted phage terminase large subunit-like protein